MPFREASMSCEISFTQGWWKICCESEASATGSLAKGWQGPQGQRAFAPTGPAFAACLQDQGLLTIVFSLPLQKRKVMKSEVI